MKRKPLRPIQVVFVQRKGEPEGVYASRPVELFFVDWTVDEGDPSHGAVYARFESEPMREVPAEAVSIFCTRGGEHVHRGDACPLELPSVDEDEVDEEEPGLPSMAEVLERRRQAFIERFGREPQGNDPIFFDPSAATPQPMNDEVVEQLTLEAMHKAKLHPAFIHAYRKTGRILAEPGVKNLSPEELQEWQDAIDEWYATHPDADPETKEPEVPDDLLGILANPINAGVSPYYPRLVSDEQWVSVAMKLASGRDPDVTPEQFFRTLLQELRKGLTYAADQNLQRVDRETRE